MLKTYNSNVNNYSDLNTFFSHIKKNKKYFNQLKIQNIFLNKTKEKSYKILPLN